MSQGKNAARYLLWIGLLVVIVAALLASGTLRPLLGSGAEAPRRDVSELRAARQTHLVPIRTLLAENGRLSAELRDKYVEYPGGIQESYYAKVRREGEAAHSDMKARIDSLNRNNLKILAHLRAYGDPLSGDLKEQAAFFTEHAIRYDERWKALPKAAVSGAELPVAQPMFPPAFPRAVAAEMAAVDAAAARAAAKR